MSSPLITIALPFYNDQHCILDALRSIFAQTYDHWELVLAGDDSSDLTRNLLLSVNDPRIRVLSAESGNRGLPAALNQIIESAKGEYLARMDADDLSHPNRLEKQLDFFLKHPTVDVLGAPMYILDSAQKPIGKNRYPIRHDRIIRHILMKIPIAHATVMAKTEWFRKWRYNEQMYRCEDYELWLRSSGSSVFANMECPLYFCNEMDSFSIIKYRHALLSKSKVIWQYGLGTDKRISAFIGLLFIYTKLGIHWIFDRLGMEQSLIRARYDSLDPSEEEAVTASLKKIRNQNLFLNDPTVNGQVSSA